MARTERGLYSGATLDEKGRRVSGTTHVETGLRVFGVSTTTDTTVPLAAGLLNLNGQALDLQARLSLSAGVLNLNGQTFTAAEAPGPPGPTTVSFSSGQLNLTGQPFTVYPSRLLVSLAAGSLTLEGQTFAVAVAGAGKSGVRRLEEVESYIHTRFLRADAAQILRKYLDETETQAETVQKLEAAEERLERVEAKLEGKLARLEGQGTPDRVQALARAAEARARVAFQLAAVRYYLQLLEEDEILLYLLTEH